MTAVSSPDRPAAPKLGRELVGQFGEAILGRGGEEGENVIEVDGAGNMASGKAVAIARVDDHTGFACHEAFEF